MPVPLSSSLLSTAEWNAERLGHAIVWDTIGDRVANGRCSTCGLTLVVARSSEGLDEMKGRALETRCGSIGAS